MRIKTTISAALLILSVLGPAPDHVWAADPTLENMRSTVGNSRADLENYRKMLVEFEKAKLKANDLEGATSAKLAIIKLDRELAAMDGGRHSAKTEPAAEKAAAERAAAEKAAAEKAAAEKAAAEKAAAEKAAAEKAAAAKAAAEKAAAEKAAAEKAAAAKAAAEKAAAEKAAAEKAAAETSPEEKAAAEKAAAEKTAAIRAATEKAAAAKAAAEEATGGKDAEREHKAAILKEHIRQLTAQGNEKFAIGDIQAAKEIKLKIGELQDELNSLSGHTNASVQDRHPAAAPAATTPAAATTTPAPPSAATAPAPKPLTPVLRSQQTKVSSVQGLAGGNKSSHNNIYPFTLSEVGPTATLTYYAAGRRSKDTAGIIWLVTPSGLREKIGVWKNGQFELAQPIPPPHNTLTPVVIDISNVVKIPGDYQVEFEWTDGIAPLIIYRVELTS